MEAMTVVTSQSGWLYTCGGCRTGRRSPSGWNRTATASNRTARYRSRAARASHAAATRRICGVNPACGAHSSRPALISLSRPHSCQAAVLKPRLPGVPGWSETRKLCAISTYQLINTTQQRFRTLDCSACSPHLIPEAEPRRQPLVTLERRLSPLAVVVDQGRVHGGLPRHATGRPRRGVGFDYTQCVPRDQAKLQFDDICFSDMSKQHNLLFGAIILTFFFKIAK